MGKMVQFGIRTRMDDHAGWAEINCPSGVPSLPILPETLLAIELMTKVPCINLSDISALILKDIGAVARIFYRATREHEKDEDPPTRIEDCISSLGVVRCLEALACLTGAWTSARAVVPIAWRHSAQVAECCRRIVVESDSLLLASDAYMVGLFHALDDLPVSLHWKSEDPQSDDRVSLAVRLVKAWGLPNAVVQYFQEIQCPDAPNTWSTIVERAHELIG